MSTTNGIYLQTTKIYADVVSGPHPWRTAAKALAHWLTINGVLAGDIVSHIDVNGHDAGRFRTGLSLEYDVAVALINGQRLGIYVDLGQEALHGKSPGVGDILSLLLSVSLWADHVQDQS